MSRRPTLARVRLNFLDALEARVQSGRSPRHRPSTFAIACRTGPSSPSASAHSSQMVTLRSCSQRTLVSPRRNHSSSMTIVPKDMRLVVTSGKPFAGRSARLVAKEALRVDVLPGAQELGSRWRPPASLRTSLRLLGTCMVSFAARFRAHAKRAKPLILGAAIPWSALRHCGGRHHYKPRKSSAMP